MPVLDSYKDRGITYNKHLLYTPHVLNITARASQCAKLILTCFTTQNPDVFMKVFIVYVRPMLEFSSTVWNPMTKQNISKVESVQKRFTKRLVGLSKISYNRRLEMLYTVKQILSSVSSVAICDDALPNSRKLLISHLFVPHWNMPHQYGPHTWPRTSTR